MRSALQMAGLAPKDVGHVNAHGLGGQISDLEEARAIHDVFGDYGARSRSSASRAIWQLRGGGRDAGTRRSLLSLQTG